MKYLATIIVTTYNHERTIKQCLESVFVNADPTKCEVLIHDDASTDNTRDVISRVTEGWSGKLSLIFPKENRSSRGQFFIEELINQSEGEVLFFIEGDDFWSTESEDRVEKMSNLVLRDERIAIAFTDTVKLDALSGTTSSLLPDILKKDLSSQQLARLEYAYLNIGACCFINRKVFFPHEFLGSTCKDLWMPLLWSPHGGAKYVSDGGVLVYRYDGGGTWSSKDPREKKLVKGIFASQLFAYYLRRGMLEALPNHYWRLEEIKSLASQDIVAPTGQLDLRAHCIPPLG